MLFQEAWLNNGCIGTPGYPEIETLTDAKGYQATNPDLDMKSGSPSVMDHFKKGEKFNKLTCVLAIQSLRGKDREVTQSVMKLECLGFKNSLAGSKDLFERYIDQAYSMEAYEILVNFYNGIELTQEDDFKR